MLKDQINLDLIDLGKIRKENLNSKSEDQTSVIKNVKNFFDLREKFFDFFRDYSFLLSEAKYKAKYGRGLRILTTKQNFKDYK